MWGFENRTFKSGSNLRLRRCRQIFKNSTEDNQPRLRKVGTQARRNLTRVPIVADQLIGIYWANLWVCFLFIWLLTMLAAYLVWIAFGTQNASLYISCLFQGELEIARNPIFSKGILRWFLAISSLIYAHPLIPQLTRVSLSGDPLFLPNHPLSLAVT